jgi:hypothetical protein
VSRSITGEKMSKSEDILFGTIAISGISLFLMYVASIFLMPVFTRWSLNCLFHTNIDATWYSYFSLVWLHLVLMWSVKIKRTK